MDSKHQTILFMGIGSPFMGDDLGINVVQGLQRRIRPCHRSQQHLWLCRDRPGVSMIGDWGVADCVVLFDALMDDGDGAVLRRLEAEQLIRNASPLSSHSIGVAETLALAQALEQLPGQLYLYGIGRGAGQTGDDWLGSLAAMLATDLAGEVCLAGAHDGGGKPAA